MKHSLDPRVDSAGGVPAAAQDQVTTPPPKYRAEQLRRDSGRPLRWARRLERSVARRGTNIHLVSHPADSVRGRRRSGATIFLRARTHLTNCRTPADRSSSCPNFVGFTVKANAKLTLGAALLTTNAWTQEIDSELITPTATGAERFAYSGDSDFSQREIALAAGYRRSNRLRLGARLAVTVMSLRLVQSVSNGVADGTGLKSLLVSSRVVGSSILVRGQGHIPVRRRLERHEPPPGL